MPRTPFIGVRISWLMLARNSLLARLAASADSFAMQQVVRLRGDAPAQDDHPGQGQDDHAGEDADQAPGRGRRSRTRGPASTSMPPSSGTSTWKERPRLLDAAGRRLARCRCRGPAAGCPAAASSRACGVVRASSTAAKAVPLASRSSVGPSGRRHALDQARLDLRPAARRRRRWRGGPDSASAARPARRADRAASGRPRGSSCRRRPWRGSRRPRRRRRRARRAAVDRPHLEGAGAVAEEDAAAAHQRRRCPATRMRRPASSGEPKRSSRSIGHSSMRYGSAGAGESTRMCASVGTNSCTPVICRRLLVIARPPRCTVTTLSTRCSGSGPANSGTWP